MMADRNKELYRRGYNFVVVLEKKKIPFQKVSGLSAEGSFEALREGGRNTVVYSLSNQNTTERTITLERGLLTDEMEFTLYEPGYRFRGEVMIGVMGANQKLVKSYYLSGCVIRRISVSDLQAENSGLVIGTMEIGYTSMEEDGNQKNSAWWRP